jgi:hypothetical protein
VSEYKKYCENTGSITDYESAFACFKQRFLVEKKSIFRSDNINSVLTQEGIKVLKEKFINNGYSGNSKSVEKFCHQLTGKKYGEHKQQGLVPEVEQAIEILATAVWLWKLAPINVNKQGRINAVNEIYELTFDKIANNTDNPFFSDSIKGFARPGMRYNMNKANELAYIILFFEKCLDKSQCNNIKADCLPDRAGKVNTRTTCEYSYVDIQKIKLPDEPSELNKVLSTTESAAVYNALLHLLDPTIYEPILSTNYKNMIADAFSDKLVDCEKTPSTLDEKIQCIN